MDGQPVWLASLSRTNIATGRLIPTARWAPSWRARAVELLRLAVAGVGDPTRERHFRMNATMCLHRALTDAEVAAMPAYFHTEPATDMAGGPVEVLWENVPGAPSTRPCARPRRTLLDPSEPDLWIPEDCGECGSCLARRGAFEERAGTG